MKIVKKLLKIILVLFILVLILVVGYFTYHDVMASAAKNYLIDKYEFSSFEVIAYNSTIFVDEDISNCNNLWFKKCTDDKNLQAKYYFINKNKEKIIVTEDVDGNFIDDYYLGNDNKENQENK